MATLATEESGRCIERWPFWGGGRGVIGTIFLGSTTCLSCKVHAYCYLGNPIIVIYRDKIYTKNLNNDVLNQNINVKKQELFATFTFSITDNLYLIF